MDKFTVRWAGRTVDVEMKQDPEVSFQRNGRLGKVRLSVVTSETTSEQAWSAAVETPRRDGTPVLPDLEDGEPVYLHSPGDSAQEALDALADDLRALHAWCADMLRGGFPS